MESSWYILHILPRKEEAEPKDRRGDQSPAADDKERPSADPSNEKSATEQVAEESKLTFPQVGSTVSHFLGASEDVKKDQENVLWDKIQDGVRPAWSPDLLRLGYAVVFKREGLPKLAVKMGLKNPLNVTEREKNGYKRVLTFDDVYVIGVVPHMAPFYFPDKDLNPEDWWMATKESRSKVAPYIAPKGVTVATGAQRLADVVVQQLRKPSTFPRIVPTMEEFEDDYSEFTNPLVPIKPVAPVMDGPRLNKTGTGNTGPGWSGIELFRWGQY